MLEWNLMIFIIFEQKAGCISALSPLTLNIVAPSPSCMSLFLPLYLLLMYLMFKCRLWSCW